MNAMKVYKRSGVLFPPSQSQQQMEVRDQLYSPAALRFEKEAPEPLEYDAGWAP